MRLPISHPRPVALSARITEPTISNVLPLAKASSSSKVGGPAGLAVRLSIGRLFVDEERAVTVSDEHGAVGVEIRPDTGVILGGRWRLRSWGRSAGKIGGIGGIIHGIEIGWDCGVLTRDLWIVSRRSDQLNQGPGNRGGMLVRRHERMGSEKWYGERDLNPQRADSEPAAFSISPSPH